MHIIVLQLVQRYHPGVPSSRPSFDTLKQHEMALKLVSRSYPDPYLSKNILFI